MKMRSAILILTLALAGCGIGRVDAPPTLFDLGLDARPVPALPARDPIALTFQSAPGLCLHCRRAIPSRCRSRPRRGCPTPA
jgi:cholesterol transport system auxiliary component